MEISGMLTEDLPTRAYRTPSAATNSYHSAPQHLQYHTPPDDEPKSTLFHCPAYGRIPLRLELRPNLTSTDLDIIIRMFFGLSGGDVIAYQKGDQRFSTIGYEDCLNTPEFTIIVTPDLRYQQHPFAHSQANIRHPSAHISGYGGGLTARAQMVYGSTRSNSPSSARERRSGSTNGTTNVIPNSSGRSRSMKRQTSGHSHPAVEQLVDEYVHDHTLYQQHTHHGPSSHSSESKMNKIEPVASADISLDNIVEGSRRKRTKFSSAELPLFSKPLHPASYSPSRILSNHQITTPSHSNNYCYYQQHTPNSVSPYSYGSQPPSSYYSGRQYAPNFPTPAPTIATDISDEDVALQLMRLGEASTTSNSPSNNDETADDAGNYSEDQGDDARSDTTELPELPPALDEDEEAVQAIQSSPSYPKNQKKYKSLNEILPSYDSTIPSDNEDAQGQSQETAKEQNQRTSQTQYHQQQQQHHQHPHSHQHNSHNHEHMDSADEDDYECDDAEDETYIAEKDEDEDADYLDDQRPASRTSHGTHRNLSRTGKTKMHNHVKSGRVEKPAQRPAPKTKPKITTAIYTSFTSNAIKPVVPKGPLSPSSPTIHRNPSISSNQSYPQNQKSRSTTASISSLPTPISGVISQHPDSLNNYNVTTNQEEDPDKPKPRCQRCRKSKKGCDRQRPCQRCKDAGIGIEGCISEDETGTRRGRAGGAKKAGTSTGAGVKKSSKPKKKVAAKH